MHAYRLMGLRYFGKVKFVYAAPACKIISQISRTAPRPPIAGVTKSHDGVLLNETMDFWHPSLSCLQWQMQIGQASHHPCINNLRVKYSNFAQTSRSATPLSSRVLINKVHAQIRHPFFYDLTFTPVIIITFTPAC